jgi:hypothetical protein
MLLVVNVTGPGALMAAATKSQVTPDGSRTAALWTPDTGEDFTFSSARRDEMRLTSSALTHDREWYLDGLEVLHPASNLVRL